MSDQFASERSGVHQGIVRISHELLAELLHLPEGARILSSICDFRRNQLLVKIEHPSLPRMPAGFTLPEVLPTITESDVGATFDWNGNGMMPGVEPTVLPNADKLAILCMDAAHRLKKLGETDGLVERLNRAVDQLCPLREVEPSAAGPVNQLMEGVKQECEKLGLNVEVAPIVYQGAPPSYLVEAEPSAPPQPDAVVDEPKKVKWREFL